MIRGKILGRHLASRRALRCYPMFGKSAQQNQLEERMHFTWLAALTGTTRVPRANPEKDSRRFDHFNA